MEFNPGLAFEPLHEQSNYQFNALKDLLLYAETNSQYYKELFKSHRIHLEHIKQLSDLSFIPTTDKTDLQEHNWEFLCVKDIDVKEYTATYDAKGRPLTIALTGNDMKRLAYGQYQSLICADGKKEDIYQLIVTLDNLFMAGMAQYIGVRELDAAVIRTGPGNPEMQWDTIYRLQANTIIALPSFILNLSAYAQNNKMPLNDSPVQKAICIGESIRRADLELNALGERIRNDWDIKLYNTYATTEMQTSFTECGAGTGCHHQPDLIIFEVLNDQGHALYSGEYGELVITTLGVEGMPLIRYRTGDICTYYETPCTCGRTSRRLSPIIGRKQQRIKFKGTSLYPSTLFEMLHHMPFVIDYIVEAYTGAFDTEELKLHIHTTLPQEVCESMMIPQLLSKLREIPSFEFHTSESIKQLQLMTSGKDSNKFIDNRQGVFPD